MAKIPAYKKDEETGAVIFQDATAYAQRKKVIEVNKLSAMAKKDSKRSINSMKREIKDLKQIVFDLIEAKAGGQEAPPAEEEGQ
jgi:hypothetical protein|tara:strand:+ start:7553 stop:7804 length:252 start_codon:yes stop_codon:yes gene_type:complete